jgi:hypothetical protein
MRGTVAVARAPGKEPRAASRKRAFDFLQSNANDLVPTASRHGTIALLALAALPACAIPPNEVHFAPLYSYHSLGSGGYTNEMVGGLLEYRHDEPKGELASTTFAIHPIFWTRSNAEESATDVLWPLGRFRFDGEEGTERFFPIWWWKRRGDIDGNTEVDWSVFPILYGGSGSPGNSYFAVFPLGGVLRDFLTYDEIWFVLFPLYVQSTKNPGNHVSRSILFPIFGWGTGDDQWSWWRVWPIYGTATYVGFYDRKFALWPIWNSEANYLDTASPSSEWSIWPIYGQIEQGAQHSRSILWPLFAWEWNDETSYWTVVAPWPLVRIQRNGSGRPYNYTRFIPLYSHYDGEEIDSQVFLWPIFWNRSEAVPDFERDSFFFAPFYYHSRTRRLVDSKPAREQEWKLGGTSMLWPLVRDREETDGRRELDTLWPIPWPFVEGFRENWLPIFSIFTHEADGRGAHSNRAFLDLFRNEANETESRWSLPILGGHRSLADGRGEWSLLLGLLRWSSGPDGSKLLMPAIPGPGFPPFESNTKNP